MSKQAHEISSTSQTFLDVYDITNNLVISQNGTTSMVMTVNAMNFGLLSEQEQDAVIFSYARLLNSLNYPIQILIQSQTKDATSYLNKLKEQEEKATDKLKQAWIKRYSQFVSELIQERNVLDKKFFVVIPATALEMGLETVQSVIPGTNKFSAESVEKSVIVEKAQNLLEPKRDHLMSQFGSIGLYARQLNTQEIIRLFYTNYNPGASEGQQITDSRNYTTPLVQARFQGGLMSDQNNQGNQPAPDAANPVSTDASAPNPGGDATPAPTTDAGGAAPAPTPAAAGISESPQVSTPGGDAAAPTTPAASPAAPAMPEPTKPANMPTGSAPAMASATPAQPAAAPVDQTQAEQTQGGGVDITEPTTAPATDVGSAAPAASPMTPPAGSATPPSAGVPNPMAAAATPKPNEGDAAAPAAGDEKQAQDAINNTLEQLGSDKGGQGK